MRKVLIQLAALFSTLVLACTPAAPPATPAASTAPKRSENQVIRIAQTAVPASMSPEASASNIALYAAMFDTLVTFGEKFAIRPQAAEKWEFSPTGWRISLRKDLKFSDGSTVTAEDVAFSINNIIERNLGQKIYVPQVTEARVIDPATVEIRTKIPDASLLNGLPWVFILPKAYYDRIGREAFQTKPIGSGPYEIAEFRPSDQAFFRKRAGGHPFRDVFATELRFQAIPDFGSVVNGLRTGDVDLTNDVAFTLDQIDQIAKEGVAIESLFSGSTQVIFPQFENDQRGTPLKEKKVRQALNYAVNREALAQTLYRGRATPAGQLTHPSSPFWIPDVKAWPYDVAKAKQLLTEAGYPNGFTLPIGAAYSPAFVNPQLVLTVQGFFRDVGVDMPANSFEQAAYLDRFRGVNGQVRPDVLFLIANDNTGTASTWRGAADCNAPPTMRHWCNQEFNRLFDQALAESDPVKRTDVLRQAHRALLADDPFVYLVVTPIFVTHQQKIQGVQFSTPIMPNIDGVFRIE